MQGISKFCYQGLLGLTVHSVLHDTQNYLLLLILIIYYHHKKNTTRSKDCSYLRPFKRLLSYSTF